MLLRQASRPSTEPTTAATALPQAVVDRRHGGADARARSTGAGTTEHHRVAGTDGGDSVRRARGPSAPASPREPRSDR